MRIGAPEVGAISLAAAASMVSGLPFVIVRKAAKEYGTTRRLEGVHAPGERVVVVEDVVTSGGAAIDSVRALRDAGLVCETVICVVDRLEGGAEAMQDEGISLYHLLTRTDLGIPE